MSLVGDFRTDRERPERARYWFGLGHELVVPPRCNANRQARAVAFGETEFAPWVEGSLKAPPNGGWPWSRLRAPGYPTNDLPGIPARRRTTPVTAAEAMRGHPGEKEALRCSDHELIHAPSERFGASRRRDQCIAEPAPKTMIGLARHEGMRALGHRIESLMPSRTKAGGDR